MQSLHVFQLCPVTQITQCPSLTAKFLAQGNTAAAAAGDRSRALNLEPCDYQVDAPTTYIATTRG